MNRNGKQAAGFVQNYDVAVQNAVPAAVDYRAGIRSVITDTSLGSEEGAGITPTQNYEPSIDVAVRNPVLTLEAGASGLFSHQEGFDQEDIDFSRASIYSRLTWNPVGLPSWRIGVEETRLRSGSQGHSDETEWDLEGNHAFGPWRFHYAGTFETLTDEGSAIDRSLVENIGRIDYQQDFDESGTNLAFGVLYDGTVRNDDIGDEATGPPIVPVAGLFAIDSTPTSGALVDRPSLVDGDTATSAGVNIGSSLSGGGTDRNIGLDIGSARAVREMRVSTDVDVGSTDSLFYVWEVYGSDDNRNWRLLTAAAAFTYDTFLRRFEITFGPSTFRYWKVVNTGVPPTSGAIFVTELTAIGEDTGSGSTRSTRDLASANLSFRIVPFDGFDVTTTILFGTTDTKDAGRQTQDETRIFVGLSARYQPVPDWDVTLSGSRDEITDPVTTDRDLNFLSTLASYRPWEGLETSLTASHREDDEDGELDFRATSIGTRVGAELDPELSASVEVTHTDAKDPDAGNETEQWSLATLVFAKLTRELQFNFEGRRDSVDVTGNTEFASPSQVILSPELIYRPGPSVLASADLEHRSGEGENGLFQKYRLDWLPFPGGTLNVEINYAFEVAAESGSGTRHGLLARIVWNLTTRSYFELLGTDQRTTEGEGNRAQSLLLTYNFSF